jgi:hypothetical protein
MLLRVARTACGVRPAPPRPAPRPGRARFATVAAAAAPPDLRGAPVLVTGSTDGIGRHTAARLAAAGAAVLVHGRSAARVEAAAAAVRAAAGSGGAPVRAYVADLSRREDVLRLAEEVAADHPEGIHTLINNAGGVKVGCHGGELRGVRAGARPGRRSARARGRAAERPPAPHTRRRRARARARAAAQACTRSARRAAPRALR